MKTDRRAAEIRRERLRILIEEISQSDLGKAANMSLSQIGQWLSGERNMSEASARRLETAARKPSGWLDEPNAPPLAVGSEIAFGRMDVTIPQFDTGGAMGAGLILRDQPGVIQSWRVSPEWLQKNVKNATAAKNLCIVTGFGDSMRPLFNPGDPLIVDRGVTSVDFDAIYFFRVGEEGFIKRLQRIPGTGLMALSENKSYQDWVVKPEMDFEVFGRVLKIWRGEDF